MTGPDSSGSMLGRGLLVLRVLAGYRGGVRLSALAAASGLPVSTTRRLLHELMADGFVQFDPDRLTYSLGLTVFTLSHSVSSVRSLQEAAAPVLRRLVDITGEQALLAVLDGAELVYIDKLSGIHQVQNNVEVGHRGPVECTSLGKALLAGLSGHERDAVISRIGGPSDRLKAELAVVVQRGYATNEEEHEIGVRSVAVSVSGQRVRPPCAICVTAPVFRMSKLDMARCVPLLVSGAKVISSRLDWDQADAGSLTGQLEYFGRAARLRTAQSSQLTPTADSID